MDQCKLCDGKPSEVEFGSSIDTCRVKCPRCGVYILTDGAIDAEPDPFIKERLHLISAVARWKSERGQRLSVDDKLLEDRSEFEARILSVCPKNTQEKMNVILAYIANKSSYPGSSIFINKESDYPLFYCNGKEELKFYIGHLEYEALIGSTGESKDHWDLRLSGDGWRKVEELSKPNIESTQAFVAMWFDDEMTSTFSDGILPLQEDTGFTMLRIDMKQFNDKICDRIIAEIRKSRFLIADVTEHRQGVYFEAGFAMGLGLPVIWTCRKDQIERCHFDTRQYNHIPWSNVDELREKLKDRILSTIGQAPK
jgi:hypothetical protein